MKSKTTKTKTTTPSKTDGAKDRQTPVPKPGIFRRLLALFFDMLPILALVVVMIKGLTMTHGTYGVNDDLLGVLGFILAFVIYFAYFAFFESIVRKTPGEFLLLIKKDKYPGFKQALKKSLMRSLARIFYLGLIVGGGYLIKLYFDLSK